MPILSKPVAALALASLCIGAPSFAASDGPPAGPAAAGKGTLARVELAQGYGRPPADIGGEIPYSRGEPDSAGLLIRIDRLENQLRQINGEIEQLQFEFRKLSSQLEKFQQDVDFRFQESTGERSAPGAPPPRPAQKRTQEQELEPRVRTAEPLPAAPDQRAGRRGDAFDPASDPHAPGAPRALGRQAAAEPWSPPRSGTLDREDRDDPDAPLDLASGRRAGAQGQAGAPPPGLATAAALSPSPAAGSPARNEFEIGLGQLRQKQYEGAEKSFTAFLARSPNDKLASDAVYYLGESYFQRGRQREAAEQYLKVSTRYGGSPRAPEALLRLGQSLNALGAKEQACAAYAEITRKYPNAAPAVKAGAEREARRAQC